MSTIQSSVTVSLVPEARGGPFVFWDDLEAACHTAAELGFDAIELFAPGPHAVTAAELQRLLSNCNLKLAAVGTGAGWVIHRLQLCDPDPDLRRRAVDFIRSMIDFGGPFQAPAIIGSMQGRWSDRVPRAEALQRLGDSLHELGEHARQYNVPLLYEPLNRYETNLITRLADGVALLQSLPTDNVKLLADLFHMNIEEAQLDAAIRAARGHIGHVHFVDSNRQPAGSGHLEFGPVAQALRDIDYHGFASAEALPIPDSATAARLTIEAFRRYLASSANFRNASAG